MAIKPAPVKLLPIQATVLGHPHLVKDSVSKAIVNRDHTEYHRRRAHKLVAKQREARIAALEAQVAAILAQLKMVK